mgnify:CR=1 FL=1
MSAAETGCENAAGHAFEWRQRGMCWQCIHCGREHSSAPAVTVERGTAQPEDAFPEAHDVPASPVRRLHSPPPHDDTVRLLRGMLAEAEAGDVQGFVLVGVRPGGATVHVRAFAPGMISEAQLLGALHAEAHGLAERYARQLRDR